MRQKITQYLLAGYPAIWIQDWEEERVCKELQRIAAAGKNGSKLDYVEWSCTKGIFSPSKGKVISDAKDPITALEYVASKESPSKTIYIFKNMHFFLENPNSKHLIIQWIKDLIPIAKETERHLIFISSQVTLPQELTKDITVLQFDLPDADILNGVLNSVLTSVAISKFDIKTSIEDKDKLKRQIAEAVLKLNVSTEDRYQLTNAALGLTTSEAENAFALTWVEHRSFSGQEPVEFVQKIKTQFINSSGLLEYIPPKFSLDDIGGLDELKKWLLTYKKAFSREASEYGLSIPKGIICTGQAGVGKSKAANATSAAWRIPLLRFDIGQIFGSLLGETEQKLRTVLRTAEALAPCILEIEEIEKSLGGMSGGNSTDGGTSGRVQATLLTWMQEKTKPVFVFATANDISKLDAALVRKGRFDEIFFVDLPTQVEREAIFKIHINKRGRNASNFDLNQLATHSEGYNGAEIESAVEASLWSTFNDGKRALTTNDIINALAATKPISITKKESILELRKWAEGRARNASSGSSPVNPEGLEDRYNDLRRIIK